MFLLAEEFNHSFGLDSIPSSPCHCQSCCSPGHSVYLISNCISIPTRAPSSQVGQSHAGLSRYHQDLWVISMLGHVLWLLWLLWLQSRGSASRTCLLVYSLSHLKTVLVLCCPCLRRCHICPCLAAPSVTLSLPCIFTVCVGSSVMCEKLPIRNWMALGFS